MLAKVGTQIFLLIRKFLGSLRNHKSATFWGVPVGKSQIRKFGIVNPQILGIPVRKSANMHGKKSSVSDPDPRCQLAFNTFYYLRKYILDYKMRC